MKTQKEVGEICKRARKRKGIYQFQIGMVLNYADTNISMFENGKNGNSRILLYYLENILSDEDKRELGVIK